MPLSTKPILVIDTHPVSCINNILRSVTCGVTAVFGPTEESQPAHKRAAHALQLPADKTMIAGTKPTKRVMPPLHIYPALKILG